MNETMHTGITDALLKIFVLALALIFFWILDSVWNTNRKWLIPIILFPPAISLFVFHYWQETRAKCFFGAATVAMLLMISGIVDLALATRVLHIVTQVSFWPYHLAYALSPDAGH